MAKLDFTLPKNKIAEIEKVLVSPVIVRTFEDDLQSLRERMLGKTFKVTKVGTNSRGESVVALIEIE